LHEKQVLMATSSRAKSPVTKQINWGTISFICIYSCFIAGVRSTTTFYRLGLLYFI